MIEPTMKATPARKKRRWVEEHRRGDEVERRSPVIEIAFGVSRESISRSRA